ncbi:MAG TPA: CDP-diacylglycerol--glycerol-3-phosphate 3-phosphatidyltransferase, partial [Planctomycetaceae bacterium]|nr:CDP-diacylglycerol--glycerol-3-phosphate 3-phosphatidyltransferase [Planctomycetaceae bacterium]
KMFLQCAAATMAMLSLDPLFKDLPWFAVTRDVSLWTMVAVTVWSGYVYVIRAIKLIAGGA